MINIELVTPEIFISLSVMFLLILGVFKKNGSSLVHNLSMGFLLITGILILNNPLKESTTLFSGSYIVDDLSSFMKILTIFAGILVLLISVISLSS